ncbi:MAG: hypothetical protein N0E48_23410, partial [Candidatus Thiodiazotropha endolucinida]|nr:hypothetical protein [Candidatus Thiodiazotropha taylori]MCW4346282.1 hypothetical protein [Candidatus Thiodiazotropha endolucinida]
MPAAPQLSFPQPGLADADVIRIATLVKQMLTEEIDRLVKEKVALETAELRNTVSTLKADNKKLADSISELEVKLSTRVDDLEQYSRRPCLRIAGLPEQDDEDTDLLVLELAGRLNADVQETDIEVSHRVGPSRGSTDDDRIGDPDGRHIKRREIIVKFRNPKARLSLLKSRTKLRKNKERLYINEDLTPTRKTLAFQCRQLRRVGKIQKTWVYNGTVNILDNGGNKVKISHISHLHPYGIETLLDNPGALH